MADKRQIEVFSAGCSVCDETVELVNRIACPSCEVKAASRHCPRRGTTLALREWGCKPYP